MQKTYAITAFNPLIKDLKNICFKSNAVIQ